MINKIVFPVGLFAESTRDSKTRFSCWFIKEVEPINKLLSEGVIVYGGPQGNDDKHARSYSTWERPGDDMKAILINIEEIKPDSFEDVVREWAAIDFDKSLLSKDELKILARAKKLLGDKE